MDGRTDGNFVAGIKEKSWVKEAKAEDDEMGRKSHVFFQIRDSHIGNFRVVDIFRGLE